MNVTRGHTQEDMDKALDLLKTYGEAFFVLSGEDIGPMEEPESAPELVGARSPRRVVRVRGAIGSYALWT